MTPDRTVNERTKEPKVSNGDFVWLTKCAFGSQHKRLLPVTRVEGVVVLVTPDELAARPRHLGDEAFPLVRVRVQLHQVVKRGERDRAADLVRPKIDQHLLQPHASRKSGRSHSRLSNTGRPRIARVQIPLAGVVHVVLGLILALVG